MGSARRVLSLLAGNVSGVTTTRRRSFSCTTRYGLQELLKEFAVSAEAKARFIVSLALMSWACYLFDDWHTFWAVFLMGIGNNVSLKVSTSQIYMERIK